MPFWIVVVLLALVLVGVGLTIFPLWWIVGAVVLVIALFGMGRLGYRH
ncbi:hydrophobic protein [Streptomycetaceae bacterium NBC_01309]